MRRVVCFALLFGLGFAPLAYCAQADVQAQMKALDAEIVQFQNARDDYAMRAQLAGNKADQLINQDWIGYKQALAKQSEYQQDVIWLDQKITELKKQKAELQAKVN